MIISAALEQSFEEKEESTNMITMGLELARLNEKSSTQGLVWTVNKESRTKRLPAEERPAPQRLSPSLYMASIWWCNGIELAKVICWSGYTFILYTIPPDAPLPSMWCTPAAFIPFFNPESSPEIWVVNPERLIVVCHMLVLDSPTSEFWSTQKCVSKSG